MKFKSVLVCILLCVLFLNTKCYNATTEQKNTITYDFLPEPSGGQIVHHNAYTLSYLEDYEQAAWVAYKLNPDSFYKKKFKRPYFIEDPDVKTHSADWRNFKNSGYDKGHLCPAGDKKESYEMYKETFYTSNISPQLREFNEGVWNRLEVKIRSWAEQYDGLYVVTGGVLNKKLPRIGKERVAVPQYFYKIICTQDYNQMVAFLIPHKPSNASLKNYVTTVDNLEKLTGIDFFPKLPDTLEEKLESEIVLKNWQF